MDKRHRISALLTLALLCCCSAFGQAFTFRDQAWLGNLARGSGDTTTLTNGLVGYWRMDAPGPVDVVGNNNLTDETPGVLAIVNGQIYHALDAQGTSSGFRESHADNLTFSPNTNSPFTISVWVTANGNPYPGNFPVFVDKGLFDTFGASDKGFLLYYNNTTFTFFIGSGVNHFGLSSSLGAPDPNAWYNIVGRYGNGRIYINVNGTNFQDSIPYTGVFMTNSSKFSLFSPSVSGSDCWSLLMDDVGYWNRALTDAEVNELYTRGSLNAKGYPWTDPTTTVVFEMDARGLNSPTLQEEFAFQSWPSNHLANVVTVISMYATTNAGATDPVYASAETNLPAVLRYAGPRTNVYWVSQFGVNDIIVAQSDPAVTELHVEQVYTNHTAALLSAGFKLLPITVYDVIDFDSGEHQWRNRLNQCITNLPGISSFLNTDPFLDTNLSAGFYNNSLSELTAAGNVLVATNLNAVFNSTFP